MIAPKFLCDSTVFSQLRTEAIKHTLRKKHFCIGVGLKKINNHISWESRLVIYNVCITFEVYSMLPSVCNSGACMILYHSILYSDISVQWVSGAELHFIINTLPEVELYYSLNKAISLPGAVRAPVPQLCPVVNTPKFSDNYVTMFIGQTTPSISIPFIQLIKPGSALYRR